MEQSTRSIPCRILPAGGAAMQAAIAAVEAGEPVAIPTETVYGLAADATNGKAAARIFEAKSRPSFNPLICHVTGISMAEVFAVFDPVSRQLAEIFWPGALTLVLPLRENHTIHPLVTAGLNTVAVRAPRGFGAELIAAVQRPLAAPSANASGRISATTAQAAAESLGAGAGLVIDGGPAKIGLESTIVKVVDEQIHLLRPGGIPVEVIEKKTGKSVIREDEAADIEAPGMLASHYAPRAGLRLDAGSVGPDEALLGFGRSRAKGAEHARAQLTLSESGDLVEAAANLFDFLRQLDETGANVIAVEPIPDSGLGEAINDRLQRAAAPRSAP